MNKSTQTYPYSLTARQTILWLRLPLICLVTMLGFPSPTANAKPINHAHCSHDCHSEVDYIEEVNEDDNYVNENNDHVMHTGNVIGGHKANLKNPNAYEDKDKIKNDAIAELEGTY